MLQAVLKLHRRCAALARIETRSRWTKFFSLAQLHGLGLLIAPVTLLCDHSSDNLTDQGIASHGAVLNLHIQHPRTPAVREMLMLCTGVQPNSAVIDPETAGFL